MTEFQVAGKLWPLPALHRHIVIAEGEILWSAGGFIFSRLPFESGKDNPISSHYLGEWAGLACGVHGLSQKLPVEGAEWQSLRSLLGRVSDAEFALAGRAMQVVTWDADHRYCGRCGGATEYHPSDRARVCPQCEFTVYPRISPCVIMLLTRGDECLLAQHAHHRHPMFTALAGFIEPGESAEQALIREVREEVGLEVGALRYVGSQSWPFPGQLMIGFLAEVTGGELRPDPAEISDARWFPRVNLPEAIPPQQTLSGQLIRTFAAEVKNEPN
ncbi:NAD(+) diphosphatase [Microbulbifer sp. SA54]|uniref:NAD(+) diphosphatase n=1 Tax=Microbulbifer sp. SA54 TaxID=3401577 RepID=UPI003AAA66F1